MTGPAPRRIGFWESADRFVEYDIALTLGPFTCQHDEPCLCNVKAHGPAFPPRPNERGFVLTNVGVGYCRAFHAAGCSCAFRLFRPTVNGA